MGNKIFFCILHPCQRTKLLRMVHRRVPGEQQCKEDTASPFIFLVGYHSEDFGGRGEKIDISLFTNECLFFSFYPRCTFRFVLGAVSPAIVVLSMLMLQARGYGTDKGIPTLLIAASSFDDIAAITGYNVFLGMAFAQNTAGIPLSHSMPPPSVPKS